MRLWHKDLIPYLPDLQLRGQWRECALIADALAKNGTPNHLLVNRIVECMPMNFSLYIRLVITQMKSRGFFVSNSSFEKIVKNLAKWNSKQKMLQLPDIVKATDAFLDWHNKEYLRVCMANLYEKHRFGIGKSRITDEEWQRLCDGYKTITGEDYVI